MRLRSEHRNTLWGLQHRMHGAVENRGYAVKVQADSAREDVSLTADATRGVDVDVANETYFECEVAPQVTEAWIDAFKCGARDCEVVVVGDAISFNRHFYDHQPLRRLRGTDVGLDVMSRGSMDMLRKVNV